MRLIRELLQYQDLHEKQRRAVNLVSVRRRHRTIRRSTNNGTHRTVQMQESNEKRELSDQLRVIRELLQYHDLHAKQRRAVNLVTVSTRHRTKRRSTNNGIHCTVQMQESNRKRKLSDRWRAIRELSQYIYYHSIKSSNVHFKANTSGTATNGARLPAFATATKANTHTNDKVVHRCHRNL